MIYDNAFGQGEQLDNKKLLWNGKRTCFGMKGLWYCILYPYYNTITITAISLLLVSFIVLSLSVRTRSHVQYLEAKPESLGCLLRTSTNPPSTYFYYITSHPRKDHFISLFHSCYHAITSSIANYKHVQWEGRRRLSLSAHFEA